VIHIPSIDTVIGGDVVYNRIHMMLALTGPADWQKWIDSIDLVESLGAQRSLPGTSNQTPATRTSKRSSMEAAPTSAIFATP
jgi:hypothetical protein